MKTRTDNLRATLCARAVLVLAAIMMTVWAPATASATPYAFDWHHYEGVSSCEDGLHITEGGAFFLANDTPLPTYSVPGTAKTAYDGTQSIQAQAAFDSSLLRPGGNEFTYRVTVLNGDNTCVLAREVVDLVSPALQSPKPLFRVDRVGTAYTGKVQLALALQEVNPALAKDIANLDAALALARKALVDDAAKVSDLAGKQSVLQQLDTELHDLVNRPLDEIGQTDLDAILDRYASVVDASTRTALEQLIKDLKKSVADLKAELTRLIEASAKYVAELLGTIAGRAEQGGFNADDPSNYELGAAPVPSVSVPDISATAGAFSPANDPYAAYASKVIAQLQADVVNGEVTQRADFTANVRAWRANQAALQKALQLRAGVSQAETNAFLNGQGRVTAVIRAYMDQADWFEQNPVSAALRAYIDGPVKKKFEDLARDLKDQLNEWRDKTPTPQEQLFDDTLRGLAAGTEDDDFDDIAQYDTRPATRAAMSEAVGASRLMGSTVVGFTPAGFFVSACEAITGWELCNNKAKQISTGARVTAGLGIAIGSATFWRKAAGVLGVGDDLARLASRLKVLPLADRLALRLKVGPATIESFKVAADTSLVSFANASLGHANPITGSASVISADALNASLLAAKWEPGWVAGTKALSGTSVANKYVRVYRAGGTSRATGRWLTTSEEIAGLSPAQIKDKLALPEVPDRIVDVNFPSGEPINVGIAGKNKFGAGGALQVEWTRTPIDWPKFAAWFVNERPL